MIKNNAENLFLAWRIRDEDGLFVPQVCDNGRSVVATQTS